MNYEEVEKQARELVDEFFESNISTREFDERVHKLGEENDAEKIIDTVLIETGAGEMLFYYREMMKRRTEAEPYALDYCRVNGLSVEKLKAQKFWHKVDDSEMGYFQQVAETSNDSIGPIRNYETLILRRNDKGGFDAEPTEYTQKYLAED